MEWFTSFIDFLKEYEGVLALIVAIIVAIVTIISSIYNTRGLKKQISIADQQLLQQRNLNQPIFGIERKICRDTEDDNIPGNETIFIYNFGQKYLNIKIEDRVFFRFKQYFPPDLSSEVYAYISDYFHRHRYNRNQNESLVYSLYGEGVHRQFLDIYMAVINANNDSSVKYLFDKIVVVKITYKDIYETSHERYFTEIDGSFMEIENEDDKYRVLFNNAYDMKTFSIQKVSYSDMKELMEEKKGIKS